MIKLTWYPCQLKKDAKALYKTLEVGIEYEYNDVQLPYLTYLGSIGLIGFKDDFPNNRNIIVRIK